MKFFNPKMPYYVCLYIQCTFLFLTSAVLFDSQSNTSTSNDLTQTENKNNFPRRNPFNN